MPSAAASAPRPHEIAALTALRGAAAWWVVLYHFHPAFEDWVLARRAIEAGYLAVDFFFVLSGFIIALTYAAALQAFSLRQSLHFLGLRLARIYPLHVTMLLLFLLNPLAILLFSRAGTLDGRYDPTYWMLSVLLVQNWGFTRELAWNVPAWSISSEFLAYLLFPLAAAAAGPAWRSRPLAVLLCLLSLALLAALLWSWGEDLGTHITRTGTPRCLLEFWAGCMVYSLWRNTPPNRRPFGLACLGAAALLAGYAIFPGAEILLVPAAWCLLVFGLARPGRIGRSWLARLVMAVGHTSYATYLVHYLIRDWVKFTLVTEDTPVLAQQAVYLGGTALAAVCLYHAVEVPGRRALRRLTDRLLPVATIR